MKFLRKRKCYLHQPLFSNLITSWCQVDLSKYLLGDKSGRLALLELRAGLGFTLLPLGEVSAPPTFE